jgi:hypothetical protein
LALGLGDQWRKEAGVHPDAVIAGIPASVVSLTALLIISYHLAHIRFVLLAAKEHPEISVPQSLTLWDPRSRLEANITQYSIKLGLPLM